MIAVHAHRMRPQAIIAFVLLCGLTATPHAAASEAAEQFIQQQANEVVEIVANRSATPRDKRSDIWQVIDRSINSEAMARATLGTYAAPFPQSEIDRYVQAFRRYVRGSYAEELSHMSDLEVEVTGSNEMRGGRGTRVTSRISIDGGRAHEVNWRVLDDQAITDIEIDGDWLVSDLSSRLAPLMQNGGLDAAIDYLNRQQHDND